MTRRDLQAVVRELAPVGPLRVALNYGNVVLVQRDPTGDSPLGVSVDLARALAARLDLELSFVHFDRASDVAGSARKGIWDLCFLAVDPARAPEIAFSAPYVTIEGDFLVPDIAPAHNVADINRLAYRVGAVTGSAYALHLGRSSKEGVQLVLFETAGGAAAALAAGKLDALAGVRQAMQQLAARLPAHRVIDEPFMAIHQSMGVPAGRPMAAGYVDQFVAEMKASGFVAKALANSGQHDVTVP